MYYLFFMLLAVNATVAGDCIKDRCYGVAGLNIAACFMHACFAVQYLFAR